MKSISTGWWIVIGIVAALLFGPELLAAAGWILGAIISIGITGLVFLAVGALLFFIVLAVGGSVALAVLVGLGAAALAILTSFWPILLVAFVLYLLIRKRPQTV